MAQQLEGGFKKRQRLLQRLDRMVQSGQVTEEEAEGLRAAHNATDFDKAVIAIRSRHAGARLAAAVESGEMSQAEADASLQRIRRGEHPQGLRTHLRKLVPRSR